MKTELVIAIANSMFCLWRLYVAVKQGRLSAVVWTLAAYFSVLFIPVVVGGPFDNHRGFTGETFTIKQKTIAFTVYYVAAFHVLFAFTEAFAWKFIGISPVRIAWSLPRKHGGLFLIRGIFLVFLCAGGFLYWLKMRDLGYRDYVEYAGSNWPVIFLWASSPFITISMMQRRYWSAFFAGMPFMLFALMLHIRSFALLSLIPAAVIAYFHLLTDNLHRHRLFTFTLKAGILLGLLLVLSAVIIHQKGGKISLPDSEMPYGTAIVIEAMKLDGVYTGFNSLTIYGLNIINPLIRLLDIQRPRMVDSPVYMAFLIDGVPENSSVYFHYPTLWYGDAYVSFGTNGLMLAALWAIVLTGWEAIMLRYPARIALMLPFYMWHTYMLIRGAPGIATTPVSYAVYISMLIFILFGGRILRLQKTTLTEQYVDVQEESIQLDRYPVMDGPVLMPDEHSTAH